MHLTIRRSYLDDFRRCLTTEWGKIEELEAAIQGKPTSLGLQAKAGTAWHEHLQFYSCWPIERIRTHSDSSTRHDYSFAADATAEAEEYIGPGLWEVPGSLDFDLGRDTVTVTGQADHLHGLCIQDQKAKFSTLNVADYEPSLQWRLYLLIHEGEVFRYNFFEFRDPTPSGYCELKSISSARFFPYAGMYSDCAQWVRQFVEWARDRDLLKHLEAT